MAHTYLQQKGVRFRIPDLDRPLGPQLPAPPDGVVLLDVLEHIENPAPFLKELFVAAAPGAALVAAVPAMRCLWSAWDEKLGHYRRYDRLLLAGQLAQAGWRVVHANYLFAGLFPVALARQRLLSSHSISETEFPRGLWFTTESRLPNLPFGSSVAALAIKD